jgi:hypothetical protein
VKFASRVWRDPLQKNSSTRMVSIDGFFKDGLDTERPAKSALSLQGFGGRVSISRFTTGGEEDSPRSSLGAFDAAFSSPSLAFSSPFLAFSLLPFAFRAFFSFFLSRCSLFFYFFALILFFSFSRRVRGPPPHHLYVHHNHCHC